jgi:hypothetical protein
MPRRIHQVFGVSKQDLESEGVFNGFVDIDANFYVDPSLLESASVPEFQNSANRFREHFQKVITILNQAKVAHEEDICFRNARNKLIFPELQAISLGNSTDGNPGKGIGKGLATKIATTAWQITCAGINDPAIFELVGLIEDKIGADRISDMTIRIILPDLLAYSERVAKNLQIQTAPFIYRDKQFLLPIDPSKKSQVVLTPRELLRDLLVSNDWSDIEKVRSQNEQLRSRTNELIGKSWKNIVGSLSKARLKNLLLNEPELLRDLLAQYKSKPAAQYDFANDPAGYFIWQELGQHFSNIFPLKFDLEGVTPENILHVVIKICNQFKSLIENNGLAIHLWKDDRKSTRNERFAQLLFFAIADSYCNAHNLDLSREPNAGRGPVDFKVSKGYHAKVTVEIKFTSNDIKSGYSKQLPIYNAAEKTEYSIFLIIRNSDLDVGLENVKKLQAVERKAGRRTPEIFEIDGRIKSSASKN